MEADEENRKLQAKINQLSDQIDEITSNARERGQELEKVKGEKEKLKREKEGIKKQLEIAKSQLAAAEQLASTKIDKQKSDDDALALRVKIQALETEKEGLKKSLSSVTKSSNANKGLVVKLNNEIAALNSEAIEIGKKHALKFTEGSEASSALKTLDVQVGERRQFKNVSAEILQKLMPPERYKEMTTGGRSINVPDIPALVMEAVQERVNEAVQKEKGKASSDTRATLESIASTIGYFNTKGWFDSMPAENLTQLPLAQYMGELNRYLVARAGAEHASIVKEEKAKHEAEEATLMLQKNTTIKNLEELRAASENEKALLQQQLLEKSAEYQTLIQQTNEISLQVERYRYFISRLGAVYYHFIHGLSLEKARELYGEDQIRLFSQMGGDYLQALEGGTETPGTFTTIYRELYNKNANKPEDEARIDFLFGAMNHFSETMTGILGSLVKKRFQYQSENELVDSHIQLHNQMYENRSDFIAAIDAVVYTLDALGNLYDLEKITDVAVTESGASSASRKAVKTIEERASSELGKVKIINERMGPVMQKMIDNDPSGWAVPLLENAIKLLKNCFLLRTKAFDEFVHRRQLAETFETPYDSLFVRNFLTEDMKVVKKISDIFVPLVPRFARLTALQISEFQKIPNLLMDFNEIHKVVNSAYVDDKKFTANLISLTTTQNRATALKKKEKTIEEETLRQQAEQNVKIRTAALEEQASLERSGVERVEPLNTPSAAFLRNLRDLPRSPAKTPLRNPF